MCVVFFAHPPGEFRDLAAATSEKYYTHYTRQAHPFKIQLKGLMVEPLTDLKVVQPFIHYILTTPLLDRLFYLTF